MERKKQIRYGAELFFKFLAMMVVIFIGISVIMPQSTTREVDQSLPFWTDLNFDNSRSISTVHKNGLMDAVSEEVFGITEPLTAGELAYMAVALNEMHNGLDRSFKAYDPAMGDAYIKAATDYGIWGEGLPVENRGVTRYELALVTNSFLTEVAEPKLSFSGIGLFKNPELVLNMYNLGIMCDTRPNRAYSPYITATRGDGANMFSAMIDSNLRHTPEAQDLSELRAKIEEKLSGYKGDWSVYFEDYTTGESISVNSHQVYSASLIKLFVAESVYRGMAEGNISDSQGINDYIRTMITYSDNDSWSSLARVLGGGVYSKGMARVTSEAQSEGFADTGTFYKGTHKNFNFTSVNDCGVFLSRVLDGTIVSEEYSKRLLTYLENQAHRHKIPSGVPEGVKTANKTGELDYIQGDAAIVYAPSGTYILVIIGDSLTNSYAHIGEFTEISSLVYNYFNPTK